MKNSLSLLTLFSCCLVLGGLSTPAFAQTNEEIIVELDEDFGGVNDPENYLGEMNEDGDGMLPMPQASQTNTIPEAVLSKPLEEELIAPGVEAAKTEIPDAESLYFESLSGDRSLRDDDIPRRVNPRFEPGSQIILVEKDARAGSNQAMLVAANRALSLGRYSSALQMFEDLYKKNKRDTVVLMGLAVAQQNSGFRESAIATYEELLEIDSDNVDAHINMLGLLKNQYPSIAYRRLVDLWENNPRNAGLAAQIGLISAELGNSDDAVHYLGIAASLEPNNANHFYNMAVVADRAGAQKRAIDYYERALELDATYGGSRTVPRDSIYDRLSKLRRL